MKMMLIGELMSVLNQMSPKNYEGMNEDMNIIENATQELNNFTNPEDIMALPYKDLLRIVNTFKVVEKVLKTIHEGAEILKDDDSIMDVDDSFFN